MKFPKIQMPISQQKTGLETGNTTDPTYPIAAVEIVVNDSKAFPGVVAPVSPTHQVLDN